MIAGKHVPLVAALILLAVGGVFLLSKAQRQTHDTTRKHHLQDIEDALYFARETAGTFPPYDQPTWCGFLSAPQNRPVRDQVEAALRAQNKKYANPDKPFPSDPLPGQDYFYWKRSPSMFELYAVLEEETSGDRNSILCPGAAPQYFDYGLASIEREHMDTTVIDSPL